MPVYATVDDYVVYTGVPAPIEIPPRVMARASQAIDKALVGARYDTDTDGLPTDPVLVDAFRDATCAQARPLVEHCIEPAPTTKTPMPIPPGCHLTTEAFDILRGAGLIPITLRMWG